MPVVGPRRQLPPVWRYPLTLLAWTIAFFGVVLLIAEITPLTPSVVAGWALGILVLIFIIGVIIAAIKGVPYR